MLPTNGGEAIRLRYDRLAYSAKAQGAELEVLAQCFGEKQEALTLNKRADDISDARQIDMRQLSLSLCWVSLAP